MKGNLHVTYKRAQKALFSRLGVIKEETPLAAEAGAVENKQQEKMSWWWLLIIALLGVTGEEMYRRNKKKKAEAAQKDEK